MATFRFTHRVSYSECTVGNHVYYSRYLDLLESARGEFFRHLGKTLLQYQQEDVIFPVIEVAVRYLAPARYDDVLSIEVAPVTVHGVRLSFAYRIFTSSEKVILEGRTHHVCAGYNEKPKRLPKELCARLEPWVVAA